MSLPLPLRVHLRTDRVDRDVTAEARDLVIRWTDPGGYHSCTVPLDRPLTEQPDEIGYYKQLVVTDARHAEVVYDGRQEDPGRSAGPDGRVWRLTAMGGQAHTQDRTVSLIYVSPLSASDFVRAATNTIGGTVNGGDDPGGSGKDALVLQFPDGLHINTGSQVNARYSALARAGLKLARIDYAMDSGVADANFRTQGIASTGGGASDLARDQGMSTGGGGSLPKVVGTDWTNGRDTLDLRSVRTVGGALTIASDNYWTSFVDVSVTAMRYNAAGVELIGPGNPTGFGGYAGTVLASDVVHDVVGRLLTQYDGAGATIATTSYPIDRLAYPDGVSSDKLFADLLILEPGYTWRVWERLSNGRFRFEFVPVPSKVRYEADVSIDQYEGPGSGDGLYNMVTVRGRDKTGQIQTIVRTSTVPALDAVGLIRQGQIDLGDELWSTANANRAGDMWLAARQFPPNSGTLKISRPIVDLQTGRMVMPWEIRPGLIRVRGIQPRPDALNATSRDGTTIFRLIAGEFRASDASVTLELDSYANTTMRQIAELMRRPATRRR